MVNHYNEDVKGFEKRIMARMWKKTVPVGPFLRTMERSEKRPAKVSSSGFDSGMHGGGHSHGNSFDRRRPDFVPAFAVKHT